MGNRFQSEAGAEANTANEILNCLENYGPLSRAAVAKRLGLSRTTISTLMTRFIEQGLVSEKEGEDPQGRGRPGIPVDMNRESWFALGAEYYSSRWVFAIINLKGEVVVTQTMQPAGDRPENFLAALVRGIEYMRSNFSGRLLPAVGVGAPGLVNWEDGSIIRADDLGWVDVRIRDVVEKKTRLSVFVLNRNRATGVAEAKYGQGKAVGNFVYIGVGTGISAAIMLGGRLLHGCGYSAGEIGHLTMDPNGPPCRCGKSGCLQTLCSSVALARMARELRDSGGVEPDGALGRAMVGELEFTGETVYRAALAGDAAANLCVDRAARHLGRAVGELITILNPKKIIIGGPLVRLSSLLVDRTREAAAGWAMAHPNSLATIEASGLDEYAGALGAACQVLRHKLELTAE